MKNIFENATISYKNGAKHIYDAIQLTKQGIYTGRIIIKTEERKEFEDHEFIPRDQIHKIIIINKHGKIKDIEL